MIANRVELTIGPLPIRARMLLVSAAAVLSAIVVFGVSKIVWKDTGPSELRCVGGEPNTTCTIWRDGSPISAPLDTSKESVGNTAAKTPRSCTILDGEVLCAVSHGDVERLRALGVGQVAVLPLDSGSSRGGDLVGALVWALAVGALMAHYLITLRRSRRRAVTVGVTADAIEVRSDGAPIVVKRSANDDVVVTPIVGPFSYPRQSVRYGSPSPVELARFVSWNGAELEPHATRLRDALAATKARG